MLVEAGWTEAERAAAEASCGGGRYCVTPLSRAPASRAAGAALLGKQRGSDDGAAGDQSHSAAARHEHWRQRVQRRSGLRLLRVEGLTT